MSLSEEAIQAALVRARDGAAAVCNAVDLAKIADRMHTFRGAAARALECVETAQARRVDRGTFAAADLLNAARNNAEIAAAAARTIVSYAAEVAEAARRAQVAVVAIREAREAVLPNEVRS